MYTIDIQVSEDENTVTVNGVAHKFVENDLIGMCSRCAFWDSDECGFNCGVYDTVVCCPRMRKDSRNGIFVKVVE